MTNFYYNFYKYRLSTRVFSRFFFCLFFYKRINYKQKAHNFSVYRFFFLKSFNVFFLVNFNFFKKEK